jgi:hypothetical protein
VRALAMATATLPMATTMLLLPKAMAMAITDVTCVE